MGAEEAAERLLAERGPEGWTDVRPAAARYHLRDEAGDEPVATDHVPWAALSSGEQAFVRLALSLWGARVDCQLWRDLGALDHELQGAVFEAVAEALGRAAWR